MKKLLIVVLFLAASQTLWAKNFHEMYNDAVNAARMRKFSEARGIFSDMIKEFPDHPLTSYIKIQLAHLLKANKEYDKAIKLYSELIETEGHQLPRDVFSSLIEIYSNTGRYNEGIELVQKLLKDDYERPELIIALADFYIQAGQKEESDFLLETSFNKNPDKDIFKKRLDIAIKSKKVKELKEQISKRESYINPMLYADFISDCCLAMGDKQQAIKELKKYCDMAFSTVLLQKLSDILFDENRHKEAIPYLTKLVDITPMNTTAVRALGHAYFILGDIEKAAEAWKKPFQYNSGKDNYIFYTTVLIEHKLYEPALDAFDSYRKDSGIPTAFSMEKANVLYALNRHEEAMEEYLIAFSSDIYNKETFDKLYSENSKSFSLENRLTELYKAHPNTALPHALIELYFRQETATSAAKITDLVSKSDGSLDEIFYNRFRQFPEIERSDFGVNLIKQILISRQDSTLALKMAVRALELIRFIPEHGEELFDAAAKAAPIGKASADLEFAANLYSKLSQNALDFKNSPQKAIFYADRILNDPMKELFPRHTLQAGFSKARALIAEEKLDEADKTIKSMKKFLEQSPIYSKYEEERLCLYNQALLEVHRENYEGALSTLAGIIEESLDSQYTNDSLKLGAMITKYSIGTGMQTLNRLFKSERLTKSGKYSEAAAQLENLISENASATAVVADAKGRLICLEEKIKDPESVIQDIDKYLKDHADSIMAADIAALKIKLLYKIPKSQKAREQAMRQFIKEYNSDLRTIAYKKDLSEKEQVNEKE